MEGAFTHLGNHLISDSTSNINAGDDESILDGDFGRLSGPSRRRRQDDDEETDVFDDDDMESMASMAVDGANGKTPKQEEEVELPPHACA
jgi:regulator of nonsense transcripts 1